MTQTLSFAKTNIMVEAKVWDKSPLYLHENVATATLPDGSKVTVDRAISNGTILLKHDDGQMYEITMAALAQAVLQDEKANHA